LQRDNRLDFLRGIGLLCIVLAHVSPPKILLQIRNFDVPLMVLVAGAVYAISIQNKPNTGYFQYIKSRFMRLAVPTWIFLVMFFFVTLIASKLMNKPYPFSDEKMISSFFFMRGIGYVWIIRVFLLVSLIAPFVKIFSVDNGFEKKKICAIIIAYLIYEVIAVQGANAHENVLINVILNEFVYMAIPYGCIFIFGMHLYSMSSRQLIIAFTISLIVFVTYFSALYMINSAFIFTQNHKYPPTAYYISYAMLSAIAFFGIVKTNIYARIPLKRHIAFFGRNSLWIYLWHIQILYFIMWTHIAFNFFVKYIIVLFVSICIVMVQIITLEKILVYFHSKRAKKYLKVIFSG